jgi:hypothetical protein
MSRVTWQPSNTREEWAPTAAASAVLEDRVRARARKKMNLPPGPQDSSYTSNDLHYARDHAQREGADNRIDATVLQEMRSPGRSRNSMSSFVRRRCCVASRIIPGLGSSA